MALQFLDLAEVELAEAIEDYNIQEKNLGNKFFEEIQEALARIVQFPQAWSKIGQNTHRYLLRKFPYSLLYVIDDEIILSVAIAHRHREPSYYSDRVT